MNEPDKKKFSISDLMRNKASAPSRNGETLFVPDSPADSSPSGKEGLPGQPRFREPKVSIPETGQAPDSGSLGPSSRLHPKRRKEDSMPAEAEPEKPGVHVQVASGGRDDFRQDQEDGDETDLLRYVAVVLRHRYVVLAAMVTGFLLALFSFLQKPEIYYSEAQLLYKPFRSGEVVSRSQSYEIWMDRENQITTFMELLSSPEILARAVKRISVPILPGNLSRATTVKRIEKTHILKIRTANANPHIAAECANELAQSLIDYHMEVNAQDITRTIKVLEEQIRKTGKELAQKEEGMRAFQEKNQFVRVSEEIGVQIKKLSQLELELQNTTLSIAETKKRLDKIQEQLQGQNVDVRLEEELTKLELELATSRSQYGAEHPRTKARVEKIESLKKLIEKQKGSKFKWYSDNPIRMTLLQELTRYRTDYVAFETKRVGLANAIEKINARITGLPGKELTQVRLLRDKQSVEDAYNLLNRKYEEAKIYRESQASALVQIQTAIPADSPSGGGNPSSLLIGLLVGLMVGAGIAFALEYMDRTIKGPMDAENLLNLPLVGAIPERDSEPATLGGGLESEKTLEPYRALRTNLQYSVSGSGPKVFMITSALQGEGKSSKASKIAVSFALDGKSVLLIDADMRRSSVHHIFQVPKEGGLSDVLTGQKGIQEVTKKTVFPGLQLITAGLKPPNPSEIVGSSSMDRFLDKVKTMYDVVIIDTPAALPVTEAAVLCPKVQAIIMVVQVFKTPSWAALQIKGNMERIGGRFVGCILNRVPQAKGYFSRYYYYSYYGYGYHYGYDYHGYSENEPAKDSRWLRRMEPFLGRMGGRVASVRAQRGWKSRTVFVAKRLWRRKYVRVLLPLLVMAGIAGSVFFALRPVHRREVSYEPIPGQETGVLAHSVSGDQPAMENSRTKIDSILLVGQLQTLYDQWREGFGARDLEAFLAFYSTRELKTSAGGPIRFKEYLQKRFRRYPEAGMRLRKIDFTGVSKAGVVCEAHVTIEYPKKEIQPTFRHRWQKGPKGWQIVSETIL